MTAPRPITIPVTTTPPIVYDSNFSVQLVPSHKHRPDVQSLAEGDEIVCATCGKPLIVVCPDGHADALDRVRYQSLLAPSSRAKQYAPPRAKVSGHSRDLPRHRLHEAPNAAGVMRQRSAADQVRRPLESAVEEGEA